MMADPGMVRLTHTECPDRGTTRVDMFFLVRAMC